MFGCQQNCQMSLGRTGLIARCRNIRTLPIFQRKIKRGQSFATKTSLFMFIQVKDWKNEGQGVAPNCMLCARS